jgi:hypothetical protein
MYIYIYMPGGISERIFVWGQPGQKAGDPIWKKTKVKQKRVGGVAQMVEHLFGKWKLWVQTPLMPISINQLINQWIHKRRGRQEVLPCSCLLTEVYLFKATSNCSRKEWDYTPCKSSTLVKSSSEHSSLWMYLSFLALWTSFYFFSLYYLYKRMWIYS